MNILGKIWSAAALAAVMMSLPLAQAQPGGRQGKASALGNRIGITLPVAQNSTSSGRTVNLQFAEGTQTESIRVVLNGRDMSDRFQGFACPGLCTSAVLTETDGLKEGENVLYATAKNQDGTASSSRMHFSGAPTAGNASGMRALSFPRAVTAAPSTVALPTMSSFLPPSVALTTLAAGGAASGANWLQLGTQIQLPIGSCTSIYSVIVLDRQTLQQKSAAPESSPQCISNGNALKLYLSSLSHAIPKLNDIVIVGTNYGITSDAGDSVALLDTSAIGGRAYNCSPAQCNLLNVPLGTTDAPYQYMAIGVPGAAPGSAYENYTTLTNTTPASATGMFVEDASGNYNFQSSGNVEYMVQPGATAAQAYIQVNYPPNQSQYQVTYWPPSISNNASGFWLLVLDRNTLAPVPAVTSVTPCTPNAPNGTSVIVPNCGLYIATGGAQGSPANITELTAALNAVTNSQIAILTTVGTAGWAAPKVMAGTGPSYGADNGTLELSGALQRFGIPDKLILQTGTTGSTFTVVGSPALGGPLNGHNVLSTNYLSEQGQTGYIHGTLAKDNHGLYEPAHTQQEPGLNFSSNTSTDDANLQLGVVLSQQPVEWPIFAAPLFGNGTLAGQIDAYKYLSWYLLNNYYFVGQLTQNGLQYAVDPPYAYDIHYFFTGSLNTWLDIHTFDPQNVPFPSNSNGCSSCTWQGPDGTQLNFTVSEFADARYQLHNEIADLTNVLTYFVTGSTNLKDLVAAGNSNAALSILQAFSTVEANINAQGVALDQKAPVKVNPWHIVNMIAGAVAPAVTFVTGGEVNTANIKIAAKAIGILGDVVTAAGSMNGGLSSGNQSNTDVLPQLDYSLDTTVGQLAGLSLQGQFLAGFDATLDSITGDWNKLNALGSSAVANQVLFSPTQATQNTTISAITTAEQRSMYMSLIPSVFQMQFWNMTSGTATLPDMGFTNKGDTGTCSSFYPGLTSPPNGAAAPGVYVSYPTYGGTSYPQNWTDNQYGYPFEYSENNPYKDWYVLSLPFVNQGHTNTTAQVMNTALANILFGSGAGQLSLSLDEFVAKFGPMDSLITGGASQWVNFSTVVNYNGYVISNGISTSQICAQNEVNNSSSVLGATPPPSTGATVTTLQMPSSAVVGDHVTLQATVMVQATSTPAGGSVQFRDGPTVLQTVTLDTTGSASYTVNTLALGPHLLSASYASTDGSKPSDSMPQTLNVYASSPDMKLSLSQSSLDVSYGTVSSATTLQVQALSGMSGTVNFACTGLPIGLACTFQPASSTITDGATVTTSFTITGTAPSTSSFGGNKGWGLLLIAVPLMLSQRIRKNGKKMAYVMFPLLLLTLLGFGSVVGCSGGSTPAQTSTLRDTGKKTVLISATSGMLTKTTPLVVNVQ